MYLYTVTCNIETKRVAATKTVFSNKSKKTRHNIKVLTQFSPQRIINQTHRTTAHKHEHLYQYATDPRLNSNLTAHPDIQRQDQ